MSVLYGFTGIPKMVLNLLPFFPRGSFADILRRATDALFASQGSLVSPLCRRWSCLMGQPVKHSGASPTYAGIVSVPSRRRRLTVPVVCLSISLLSLLISTETLRAVPPQEADPALQKITFDYTQLSPDGLTGMAGSWRSVSYEFCIPATASQAAEVQAIDPSLHIYPHSRGRIGCTAQEYLCIGNTHQPNWQTVLQRLARLEYIQRIDEFWGE